MLIHPGGWTKLSTNFSSWRCHANSQVAWLHYDIAFKKDAATSGLAYWSCMNLDMYNFHTRASLPQTNLPSNAPLLTSRVVTSLSSFCWSWNDGTCHCHLANAVTTIAARIVEVSTLASTVLFCPWVSSCGQLPLFPLHQWHWYGSQIVPHYSMFQENFVHNVDIPHSIQSSNFVVPVSFTVLTSTRLHCRASFHSVPTSHPYLSSIMCSLQQGLVSPSRVTPINS